MAFTTEQRDRLWAGAVADGSGCWPWRGASSSGDGKMSIAGRTRRGHRVAYEIVKGPIPDGLTIDHLCRNRRCINPEHLEAVTNRENVLRGEGLSAQNARKTHCPQSHQYTYANTAIDRRGKRYCRTCRGQTV